MTEQNSAMLNKPGGPLKGGGRKPGGRRSGQTRMFRRYRVYCTALPGNPEPGASRPKYGCALDDQKRSQCLDGHLKESFFEHRLIEIMVTLSYMAHSKSADLSPSRVT